MSHHRGWRTGSKGAEALRHPTVTEAERRLEQARQVLLSFPTLYCQICGPRPPCTLRLPIKLLSTQTRLLTALESQASLSSPRSLTKSARVYGSAALRQPFVLDPPSLSTSVWTGNSEVQSWTVDMPVPWLGPPGCRGGACKRLQLLCICIFQLAQPYQKK